MEKLKKNGNEGILREGEIIKEEQVEMVVRGEI